MGGGVSELHICEKNRDEIKKKKLIQIKLKI